MICVESALNFHALNISLQWALREMGEVVDVGEWQSIRREEKDIPQQRTIELQNVVFEYPIPETRMELEVDVQPNLPWAEDHFLERVGGEPLNPGVEYQNWPWYQGNVEEHKTPGKFSHTYMERYWPKQAPEGGERVTGRHSRKPVVGIRYPYGDLQDVVSLLQKSPGTRQAVLPVWFPEDTGNVQGARVPCSLSYHFLRRDGRLHCSYSIRSCDFFRHFRDDVYLTCRLVQWVLEQLPDDEWDYIKPGNLLMNIGSLHVFEAERKRLENIV